MAMCFLNGSNTRCGAALDHRRRQLLVQNEKAQCSYDIALLDDDTKASWGLVNEVINPNGGERKRLPFEDRNLVQGESPAEKAKRLERIRGR